MHAESHSPCLLNLPEAAAVLRVEQRILYRQARRGKIPGTVKLPGGEIRFDREILYRWLRESAKGVSR